MKILSRKWCLVWLLVFSSQALAYIPSAAYILDQWARLYTGTKKIQAQLKFYAIGTEHVLYQESLMYWLQKPFEAPTTMISQLKGNSFVLSKKIDQISLISILQWGSTMADGISALKKQGILSAGFLPTDHPSFDELAVNSDPVQLKRWNTTYAWVLGAGSELWIEKDKFLPLRFVFQQKKEGDRYEVQWSQYRLVRGYPYASEMKVFKNSNPFLAIQVRSLEVNPASSMVQVSEMGNSDVLHWYHDVLR
jgi:hypothetical protein